MRSRLRKKIYQEELEEQLAVHEKYKAEMNEKLRILQEQNDALKKQVNYF